MEKQDFSKGCPGVFDVLDNAIGSENWWIVHNEFRMLLKSGFLNHWYAHNALCLAISESGYECYTCFMKSKGVCPEEYVCFQNHTPEIAEKMRKRKCGIHQRP